MKKRLQNRFRWVSFQIIYLIRLTLDRLNLTNQSKHIIKDFVGFDPINKSQGKSIIARTSAVFSAKANFLLQLFESKT